MVQSNFENSLVAIMYDEAKDGEEFFVKEVRRMREPEAFKRGLYIDDGINDFLSTGVREFFWGRFLHR